MPIGADWTLDTTLDAIRHVSGATVYTVNEWYIWIQSVIDGLGYMAEDVPIFSRHPTYQLINGWFVDVESTKYLKSGELVSVGWTHPANPTGIRRLQFDGIYTNCIPTDVGKPVVGGGSGDSGLLLYYDNTLKKWWIRCDAAGDTFAGAEAITITGGTGAGTTLGASISGEENFPNIYTLGAIEAGTEIYLIQDEEKKVSWWPAGHMDILVRVKEMGVLIDSGYLTPYARMWTDSFDFFEMDMSAGGRSAIPIATSDDLSNTDPEATVANYNNILVGFVNNSLNFDTGVGTGLAVSKMLFDSIAVCTGLLLNVTDGGATGSLVIGNATGTFANNDDLEILAELNFDGQLGLFTVNQVVTGGWSGATGTIRAVIQDPQAVGTVGRLYLSSVGGPAFQDNEPLTDPITGSATAYGTLTAAPTWTAKVDGAVSVVHTTTKDLSNGDGAQPYDVIIDCANRTFSEVYQFLKYLCREDSTNQMYQVVAGVVTPIDGEQYQAAYAGYSPVKAAPFGLVSGVKFFGARGVYVFNMNATDINNYQLIDSNNVPRLPPNRQHVTVSNLQVGDMVCVFKLVGAGGALDKNMCGGCGATPAGSAYLDVVGPIPSDTPETGKVRIVDTSLGVEYIHTYSGISGNRFTGLNPVLAVDIVGADTVYVPYVDEIAAGATISVAIIQTVTRNIVTRTRQYGYLPYMVEGTIDVNGASIIATRDTDIAVT